MHLQHHEEEGNGRALPMMTAAAAGEVRPVLTWGGDRQGKGGNCICEHVNTGYGVETL